VSDFLAEMEARRTRAAKPRAPVGWTVAAFAVALFATLFELPLIHEAAVEVAGGAGDPFRHAVFALGLALATTLVVGGLLWVVFLRPRQPAWSLPVLAAMLLMTSLVSFGLSRTIGEAAEKERQQRIAVAEMKAALSLIQQGDVEKMVIDPRPKARGEAGEVERVVKQSFADMLKVAKAYRAEMNALELDRYAGAPPSRGSLQEQARRLKTARELTARYRTDVNAAIGRIRPTIEASDIGAAGKAAFLRGFDGALERGSGDLDRQFALSLKLIDLNLEQVNFLLGRPGAWKAQGREVAFYRQQDLDRFREMATEIRTIASEMEAIERRQRQALQDNIDAPVGPF